jgi:hypothetical protein
MLCCLASIGGNEAFSDNIDHAFIVSKRTEKVSLESYIFKIALDEFASSPQLPHTRSSGWSISWKKAAAREC